MPPSPPCCPPPPPDAETPALSSASCAKLRPFSGRVVTCSSLITLAEMRGFGVGERDVAFDRDRLRGLRDR